MGAVRIIAIALLAAFAGVLAMSFLLYQEVDAASFAPLVFAVPGALLVATAQGCAVEDGWPVPTAYAAAAILGLVFGAFLLRGIGAEYAAVIIVVWIGLDLALPRARGR